MVSVVCLVVTQQEGYLYYFKVHSLQEPSRLQQAACVTVYPFTALVTAVVMESYVLHALTESGLETYTLKTGCQFASTLDLLNNMTSVSILYGSVLWSFSSPVCSWAYIFSGTAVDSDLVLLFLNPWSDFLVYRQSFYEILLIEVPFSQIWVVVPGASCCLQLQVFTNAQNVLLPQDGLHRSNNMTNWPLVPSLRPSITEVLFSAKVEFVFLGRNF